jgi:hypothetical protein
VQRVETVAGEGDANGMTVALLVMGNVPDTFSEVGGDGTASTSTGDATVYAPSSDDDNGADGDGAGGGGGGGGGSPEELELLADSSAEELDLSPPAAATPEPPANAPPAARFAGLSEVGFVDAATALEDVRFDAFDTTAAAAPPLAAPRNRLNRGDALPLW